MFGVVNEALCRQHQNIHEYCYKGPPKCSDEQGVAIGLVTFRVSERETSVSPKQEKPPTAHCTILISHTLFQVLGVKLQ